MVAFRILESNKNVTIGYKYIDDYILFDVKMKRLVCKARLVARGHQIDVPSKSVFLSIVFVTANKLCYY